MTKNLADELGPSGVNVTVVHPGTTRTEATPGTIAALATAQGVEEGVIAQRFAGMTTIGRWSTLMKSPKSSPSWRRR
jgi:NAD(P)-dependent dehydrogenase (short-subunit alcohol dehydrogenase family)